MKTLLTVMVGLCLSATALAQTSIPFDISLEEVTITGVPGVQSYAIGQDSQGRWLIIGGRTDGVHKRRPPESFLASDNNTELVVIDPNSLSWYSAPLSALPTAIEEQLQSTNMEFEQLGNVLYIIGGYSYSNTAGDHITHDKLTAVDVSETIDAIVNGTSYSAYFRQLTDSRMKVAGGYLGLMDSTFYLCGGQLFDGRYNPHGPTHGPGFIQDYTDAIRSFKVVDDGSSLSIVDYNEWVDSANLHRRDYNMVPQIFPDGGRGFTMFSGVFQHLVDLPWLNSVDVQASGYTVNNSFSQYLSQYHSAVMPIHDSVANDMYTVFFGGMAQYTQSASGNLIEDTDVPNVNTISAVIRHGDGSMEEVKLLIEMPGLLGASAEFIPLQNLVQEMDILPLNALPQEKVLVGYIFGGIESAQANVFFDDTPGITWASNRLFKVYIDPSQPMALDEVQYAENIFNIELSPNPTNGKVAVRFEVPEAGTYNIRVLDVNGRTVGQMDMGNLGEGAYNISFDLSALQTGLYLVEIKGAELISSAKLLKQ